MQQQPEPGQRRASSACSTAPRRSIGCMAGLLRLISPYHRSHHRKRLTAKNNAAQASAPPSQPSSPTKKNAAAAASPSPAPSPVKPTQQPQPQPQPLAGVRRRRSCDAPRSPTIAPEHRRSSCDSPRQPPPAIVARLMGLEESAPPSPAAAAPRPVVPTRPPPPPPPQAAETAAEKRRKLLGALEKCDEDLKTLRRIIAAVRAAEMRAAAASDVAPVAGTTPPAGKGGAAKWIANHNELSPTPRQHNKPRTSEKQQYPSPDSVLDAISSPRFPCRKRPSPCTDHDAGGKAGCGNGAVAPTIGSKIVKPSRTLVFSGDYCKIKSGDESSLQLHAVHYGGMPLVVGMPRSAGAESWRHHRRRWELEAAAAGRVISRAMAESAGEAMWGPQGQGGAGDDEQRRERAGVAAALERAIVQDLVADLLSELLAQAGRGHGGTRCRKRLCF
ncbi:hypothetical protein BAE44_0017774 [Dichanthelium oligosanthes]|uniref:DUF3741 domain-containing protein n=1 Tax=Dichanthelium oligosanthes TaxID=888268 RepID=A0A1E5V885_9POAL|nr:hypothetical protein BAE44_0017774 [Dichanthelium oligosanthes]